MAVFIASYVFIMFLVVCAAVNEYIIEPRMMKARIEKDLDRSIF